MTGGVQIKLAGSGAIEQPSLELAVLDQFDDTGDDALGVE